MERLTDEGNARLSEFQIREGPVSYSLRSGFGSHRPGEIAPADQGRRSASMYFARLSSSTTGAHDVTTGADRTSHGTAGRGVAIAVGLSAVLWPVIVAVAWAL